MRSSVKKIYIKTFGCQMNARDSEYVTGILAEAGFRLADTPERADILLFNSCAVRQHAEDRLFSNIAQYAKLKKRRPRLLVGLMGCVAQLYGEKAFRRLPVIDFVCGPGNEWELPLILRGILAERTPVVATDKVHEKRPESFPSYRESLFKAYVSIGEGCNNFCSYCIVPYVRGRERSRRIADIVCEVRELAARGFKEITLLGQNVNSFGRETRGRGAKRSLPGGDARRATKFIALLNQVNRVPGIERIRFMTSHPKDASPDLFMAMRDLPKVCEHLHLPLQSGSDRILKAMTRGYTRLHYLRLAEDFRKTVPLGSITTDIIVGFPGETETDFKKTVDVMRKICFDASFDFKYSPRPPAKASRLKDSVPEEVKQKRLEEIIALQRRLSEKRNLPFVGKTVEVLVDAVSPREEGMLVGRTRTNKTAVFAGRKELVGSLLNVKVKTVTPYALKGSVI